MHFIFVLYACKSVDRGTFFVISASYKMCFGPRFYTPIKLQKNAFNKRFIQKMCE